MDPTAIVNLSLLALQAVLNVISEIKGQSGLTDDQVLAQAEALVGATDKLYLTLKASLAGTPSPPAVGPATPTDPTAPTQ